MILDPPTKLTPEIWTWDGTRPGDDWLSRCPADLPLVWQAWLTDAPSVLRDLASLLSAEERARLERLQILEDRQRFLVGRGLLRIFLGAQLNIPAERVEIQYGPFGKPFLVPPAGKPMFHFNVSHSGKLVLLAFHPARQVGVDVEQLRPDQDWDAVARRMFPAGEYRGWTSLNPNERLTAFFRAWTRHEARSKTLGLGFSDESMASPDTRLACFDLEMPAGYQGAVGCL